VRLCAGHTCAGWPLRKTALFEEPCHGSMLSYHFIWPTWYCCAVHGAVPLPGPHCTPVHCTVCNEHRVWHTSAAHGCPEYCSSAACAAAPCCAALCPAELPDVRTSTPVSSVARDPKKQSVTVQTASGQKATYVPAAHNYKPPCTGCRAVDTAFDLLPRWRNACGSTTKLNMSIS
jgi:hypothetical protein